MKESEDNIVAPPWKESVFGGLHKRTVWIRIVLLLVVVVGGTVGGVVYWFGNDDTAAPTQLDNNDIAAPTQLDPPLLQELKPWIAPTEFDTLPFNNTASPQSLALAWLSDDPITRSTGRATSVVLERYVLAVFYYSTGGSRGAWYDHFNFLSDADVCTWNDGTDTANGGRGVFCSSDDMRTIDWVDLKDNNLQGPLLPWELSLLTSLKHIDLGLNGMGGLSR